MSKPVVFLIEDDHLVSDVMAEGLESEGYAVISAQSARDAVLKLPSARPDIILLDLILPDGDGLSLMKNIRAATDVPVIIISGKNELVDKVVGLEMGADDYVSKPVQIKEITARVKAQLRRYQSSSKAGMENQERIKKDDARRLSFAGWVLDRDQFQLFDPEGSPANLTVREFRLLDILVSTPNCVFSRERLLDKMHEGNYAVTDRAIDVQIMRIRRKLNEKAGGDEIIRSIRGIGYMFVAETEAL
jgi:DNA-binding response OmpR family regulator